MGTRFLKAGGQRFSSPWLVKFALMVLALWATPVLAVAGGLADGCCCGGESFVESSSTAVPAAIEGNISCCSSKSLVSDDCQCHLSSETNASNTEAAQFTSGPTFSLNSEYTSLSPTLNVSSEEVSLPDSEQKKPFSVPIYLAHASLLI